MGSLNHPNLRSAQKEQSKKIVNPFVHIQQEVDKVLHGFYDIFESKPFELAHFEKLGMSSAMDLVEDRNGFKIEVEMPGLDEKDIKISLNDNLLVISGEKSVSKKDEQKKYIAREISYGRYERCITLPQSSDLNKISANFKKRRLWRKIACIFWLLIKAPVAQEPFYLISKVKL